MALVVIAGYRDNDGEELIDAGREKLLAARLVQCKQVDFFLWQRQRITVSTGDPDRCAFAIVVAQHRWLRPIPRSDIEQQLVQIDAWGTWMVEAQHRGQRAGHQPGLGTDSAEQVVAFVLNRHITQDS